MSSVRLSHSRNMLHMENFRKPVLFSNNLQVGALICMIEILWLPWKIETTKKYRDSNLHLLKWTCFAIIIVNNDPSLHYIKKITDGCLFLVTLILTIFCQRQILKLVWHDFNKCVLEFNYLNSSDFEKWSVNLVFTSYNFIKWRPCFGLYLLKSDMSTQSVIKCCLVHTSPKCVCLKITYAILYPFRSSKTS